jgi:predicted PurR-regulated permease PerM
VSFWAEVSLAVIAVATLTMALIQVSVIVYGWILARRISRLVGQIEQEIKPLAESVNAMARDAARATALAAAQVERVDKLFGDLVDKIEETASTVQKVVITPLREGAALMAGLRAAMDVFRELSGGSRAARARSDEEDTLFIG